MNHSAASPRETLAHYHVRRAAQERLAARNASQCWHRDLHNDLADLHDAAARGETVERDGS